MSAFLFLLAASIVPAGEAFTCTPEAVWDGDGPVWCEEGPRLRIAGMLPANSMAPVPMVTPAPPPMRWLRAMRWSI